VNVFKAKLKSKKAKVLTLFCFLIFLWVIISPLFAKFLIIEKPLAKADAIWVLGGSSVYVERTQKAAELYRQKIADKIFVIDDNSRGGWNDGEKRNIPFYELSRRELIANGVDENAIEIVKPIGDGTNYEAQLFAQLNQQKQIKSLLLVTSAYHTRRALWTFEHFSTQNAQQIEIGIEPTKFNQQMPTTFYWWLTSKGWEFVAGEYLKFCYYWLFL
jgi:uncharacterized SAM-binding protein YcdF (DUF218 family)